MVGVSATGQKSFRHGGLVPWVLSSCSSLFGGFPGSSVVEHFSLQCGLERENVCLRNRCQPGVARVMDEALDGTLMIQFRWFLLTRVPPRKWNRRQHCVQTRLLSKCPLGAWPVGYFKSYQFLGNPPARCSSEANRHNSVERNWMMTENLQGHTQYTTSQ